MNSSFINLLFIPLFALGVAIVVSAVYYYARFLEKTSYEKVIELAKEVFLNRDNIAKELEEKTKILGERILFSVRYASKLLENKSNE